MADMFETLDTCPVPVIVRVQGAALGGGMGLCAVGDLVIAESGANFGFTETRLGILPAVISPFVIAKIGETPRARAVPVGRRFDAVRAQRIGLVHELVEGEASLDAAVDAAVDDVLAAGPTAARAAKAIVREVRGPVARLGEMAHRTGHRPPARERGGAGRLPRLRRERAGPGADRPGRVTALARRRHSVTGARRRARRWLERLAPRRSAGTSAGCGRRPRLEPRRWRAPRRRAAARDDDHSRAVRDRRLGVPPAAPWVIFGIPAGAFIDRHDRRRLSIGVNLLRALVLGCLAMTSRPARSRSRRSSWRCLLIGTAETFADNAGGALVATTVPKPGSGRELPALGYEHPDQPAPGTAARRAPVRVRDGAPVRARRGARAGRRRPRSPHRNAARCRRDPAEATPSPPRDRRRHALAVAESAGPGAVPDDLLFNVTFGAAMSCTCCWRGSGWGSTTRLRRAHHRGRDRRPDRRGAYPALERRFSLATLMRAGLGSRPSLT